MQPKLHLSGSFFSRDNKDSYENGGIPDQVTYAWTKDKESAAEFSAMMEHSWLTNAKTRDIRA